MQASNIGFEQGKHKTEKNNNSTIKNNINKNYRGNNGNKPYIVVPYMKGMNELQKHLQKAWYRMYFKEGSRIKELLVHTKDKDTTLQKIVVIYRYKCGRVDCEEEYIGESDRTFAERFREHVRATHPHMTITSPLVMNCLWITLA